MDLRPVGATWRPVIERHPHSVIPIPPFLEVVQLGECPPDERDEQHERIRLGAAASLGANRPQVSLRARSGPRREPLQIALRLFSWHAVPLEGVRPRTRSRSATTSRISRSAPSFAVAVPVPVPVAVQESRSRATCCSGGRRRPPIRPGWLIQRVSDRTAFLCSRSAIRMTASVSGRSRASPRRRKPEGHRDDEVEALPLAD